jgi:hypothetical protein
MHGEAFQGRVEVLKSRNSLIPETHYYEIVKQWARGDRAATAMIEKGACDDREGNYDDGLSRLDRYELERSRADDAPFMISRCCPAGKAFFAEQSQRDCPAGKTFFAEQSQRGCPTGKAFLQNEANG